MKNLNEMLDRIQESKDWSRQVAEKVLLTRRSKKRKAGFAALTLAVSFIVIGGAVSLQQKAKEDSFKYVFSSALEEVLPGYEADTITITSK